MNQQEKVADFIEKHDMDGTPEFRILDLVSEIGEVAKDATKSAGYGVEPENLSVKKKMRSEMYCFQFLRSQNRLI